MEDAIFWLPVGDRDVVTAFLEHPLTLPQHDGYVQVRLVPAQQRIYC